MPCSLARATANRRHHMRTSASHSARGESLQTAAVPENPDALLTRAQAGAALRDAGFPVADKTLAEKPAPAAGRGAGVSGDHHCTDWPIFSGGRKAG